MTQLLEPLWVAKQGTKENQIKAIPHWIDGVNPEKKKSKKREKTGGKTSLRVPKTKGKVTRKKKRPGLTQKKRTKDFSCSGGWPRKSCGPNDIG